MKTVLKAIINDEYYLLRPGPHRMSYAAHAKALKSFTAETGSHDKYNCPRAV